MNANDAINLAVSSVIKNGCSDITKETLDIKLIKEFETEFKNDVTAKLKKSAIYEMEFRPLQYVLTPKNRYVFDYRKAAIIHPEDVVKFNAIVFQYADKVEASRVPTSKNVVYSYRFIGKNGLVFDENIGYQQWMENTKTMISTKCHNYLVSCDIAAFYDRINIHRIESTLVDIGVDAGLVKTTNDLLLFWSKKDSYGLPVGNVGSRVLAEVALIDIDEYLLSEGVIFTRYVDDYRIFAPDLVTAQKWMNKLTTRLFRDGLMLNTGKTRVKRISFDEAEKETDVGVGKAERVLKEITKLSGGYSRIARRFVMPAAEKHAAFLAINIEGELATLEGQSIYEFDGIQKVVVATLVKKEFSQLIKIAELCKKYLYGLDYFVDMLLKNAEFIPEKHRHELADCFQSLVMEQNYYEFEWHSATLAHLLSHELYYRKRALMHLFQSPGKVISTYASMIALEGLAGNLTRSEFKTIREYFDRCDEWEKRRLVYASRALPSDERSAWAKAVKSTVSSDVLCYKYVESIIKDKAI